MQAKYDAIVIGAGLGGLTAAAMCATAGKSVLVLEKNDQPGGAAGCFTRQGRRFEISLHETTHPFRGADPKARIFDALDLTHRLEFIPVQEFCQLRAPLVGDPITLPHGLDALQRTLTARFPTEADAIARFLRQVRRTQEAISLMLQRHDGAWWLAHAADIPLDLWAVVRDMGSTLTEVLTRYFGDNEALKLCLAPNLPYYTDDPDTFWWLAYAIAQGGFLSEGGYYIKGGSQALVDALVAVIRENGGHVATGHHVSRLLLDADGAADSVWFHDTALDATEVKAPLVFANAAPHAVAQMLPEDTRPDFTAPFADKPLSISLFEISIALTRPASELGLTSYSTALFPEWVETLEDYHGAARVLSRMPGDRMPPMIVVDYGQIDSGLAPDGPAPLSITGVDRIENWEGLSDADYAARKQAWTQAIIARIDTEFPGFAEAVDFADMATARTMRDTLGTPGGAVYGFAPNVPGFRLPGPRNQTSAVTSVPGLYLASAFAGFGGFTGAMGSGAMAAMRALNDD